MYIDKQNTFFYKQALTANTNSDVVMNGNGGDAEKSLWLVIRIDKDVTGTPLFNLYTSNTENIANAVLLHGITLPANSKAGTKVAVRLGSGAKKYLKLNANNMTGGTITAFLTPDVRLVPVGDASAEVEETEETEEPTPKKRGKKAEETAE